MTRARNSALALREKRGRVDRAIDETARRRDEHLRSLRYTRIIRRGKNAEVGETDRSSDILMARINRT